MIAIKLPFWLGGAQLEKLVRGCVAWWDTAEGWIKYPLSQFDELTCAPPILDLLAYQRDITKLPSEPIELYRRRVKFALANAKDAGSVDGFIAIFERLDLGYVILVERFNAVNWDVIRLHLSDNKIAANRELMTEIIRLYGRTCRRYEFSFTCIKPRFDDGITRLDGGVTRWMDGIIHFDDGIVQWNDGVAQWDIASTGCGGLLRWDDGIVQWNDGVAQWNGLQVGWWT
jgi:hypothetical protein